MKQASYAPSNQVNVSLGRIWDFVALLVGVAASAALFALPWLEGRNGIYNASQILLGQFDEKRLDYTLIFLPFLVGLIALVAPLASLISVKDSKHWKVFYFSAGLLGLFYFFNYFINKGNLGKKALENIHTGFWVFLGVSVALTLLGLVPRAFSRDHAPTRMDKIMGSSRFWGFMYVLPMFVLMVVFTIYPVLDSFRISLYNYKGFGEATQFVGFRHFVTIMNDDRFWDAFRNTVLYSVILVPVQLTLALLLAVILDGPRMRLRTFYKTIYFMPVVTSIAIVGIVMRLMYQSGGTAITSLFVPWLLDKPINPIGDYRTAIYTVTAFGIWYSFGINLVYFLAALQTVSRELYDAAAVDGANWLQRVRHITLPGIRSVSIIILFFAILGSLKVFEQSFVLTGGGPSFASEVVSGYIYSYAFGSATGSTGAAVTRNVGYASAAAVLMSIIVLGVTLLQLLANRLFVRGRS
ncbi:MAG: carbohydrate ABC transporter permease [Trueperaceae bacterium]